MTDKQDIKLTIFGNPLAIRTEDDPRYVKRLARYVDEHMKEISKSTKAVTTTRIAILTALTIADELFKLRDEYQGTGASFERRIDDMLQIVQTARTG